METLLSIVNVFEKGVRNINGHDIEPFLSVYDSILVMQILSYLFINRSPSWTKFWRAC